MASAGQKVTAFPSFHAMSAAARAAAVVLLCLGLGLGAFFGHAAHRSAWRMAHDRTTLIVDEYFQTVPGDGISDFYLAFMGYDDVK